MKRNRSNTRTSILTGYIYIYSRLYFVNENYNIHDNLPFHSVSQGEDLDHSRLMN